MLTENQSQLYHLNQLSNPFSYGRASARILDAKDASRSGRVIMRNLDEIIEELQLKIPVPQTRRVIQHDNGNAFAETLIGNLPHYLMVRNTVNGEGIHEALQGNKPELALFTGSCLFSAFGVNAIGMSGKEYAFTTRDQDINESIVSMAVNEKLSIYEIETISRLGNFMNNLIKGNDHITKATLSIPRIEYYLFAMDAYENGFLSSQQVLSWMQSVDIRSERIARLLSSRIRRGFQEFPVEVSSPLKYIDNYIRMSITKGAIPTIREAKNILLKDDLWNHFLSVSSVENWQNLIDLSYVYAELAAAQQKNEQLHFAVIIDNPTESKIFSNAKKLAESLNQGGNAYNFNAVALFPHEHLIPPKNQTMYHIDTSVQLDSSLARRIIQTYKNKKT